MRAASLIVGILVAASLTGCATHWQRVTSADGLSNDERETRRNKQWVMAEGTSGEDFLRAWGSPDHIVRKNSLAAAWYQNGDFPIIFFFESGKLIGWRWDTETANQMRAQREMENRRLGIAAFEGLSALGEAMQRQGN
jgi:hypothetical protein